ncbi:MAG: uracil-DNA glycosylase [Gaiellales bacterium]|nr:uracil-DNA glycosylase [Gaiellales bacterium]
MGMSAAPFVPDTRDLDALRRAAAECRGCELWKNATQTVFGEGPPDADVMVAGEQPGDQEDKQGRPFVGPAGGVLWRAFDRVGIAREQVYATNVVKHFKWEARGKRRIHKAPNRIEIVACKPWFAAELDAITPQILVLLGATAAKSVLGSSFRVTRQRGVVLEGPNGIPTVATVHPSSILRSEDEGRKQAFGEFVRDLAVAAEFVSRPSRRRGPPANESRSQSSAGSQR